MKYGATGRFIKLVFAKTAFDYIAKEIPGTDMPSCKKRVYGKGNRQPHTAVNMDARPY